MDAERRTAERRTDFAIALRQIAKSPSNDSWTAFTDLITAVSSILEGAEGLIPPQEMQARFAAAWQASAKVWQAEIPRIVGDCLGGPEEFERIRSHPNGGNVIGRILTRVREVHGDLTPGMVVDIEVGDILVEELGDEDGPPEDGGYPERN
ncbi:hypothetical protein LCGC14_2285830 [marine sediment metagenome]|uniref:Uncharacterized protein n=1 Tax=marine sediment metagenome TaxID=412755 RepID=A0A0F9CT60_9ZZZZ